MLLKNVPNEILLLELMMTMIFWWCCIKAQQTLSQGKGNFFDLCPRFNLRRNTPAAKGLVFPLTFIGMGHNLDRHLHFYPPDLLTSSQPLYVGVIRG